MVVSLITVRDSLRGFRRPERAWDMPRARDDCREVTDPGPDPGTDPGAGVGAGTSGDDNTEEGSAAWPGGGLPCEGPPPPKTLPIREL